MALNCFICQHCNQPLKWNQSSTLLETPKDNSAKEPDIKNLISAECEPEAKKESSDSFNDSDIGDLQNGALSSYERLSNDKPDRFILLGHLDSVRTLNSIQKMTVDVFDILSGKNDIDHPLCEDCTDKLLETLDTQLTITESEIKEYKEHLKNGECTPEDERKALQEELKELELEEERLTQDLHQVEKTQEKAAADLEVAQAETKMLEEQEKLFQKDYRQLQWQKLELQDELRSLENQLGYTKNQEAQLEKINIFSTTFEIWSDDHLGIINDLRLGTLPSVPVSWSEINAAWGQTALLLLALAKTIGLEFKRYELVPCGDHSYLKSLTQDTTYLPLFYGSKKNIWLYYKFDKAMMAFLDCMQQFQNEAKKGELGLHLPYRIHVKEGLMEDPAGGGKFYSIRTYMNTKEQWTKALKLMLTNLKWSLTWASLKYRQK